MVGLICVVGWVRTELRPWGQMVHAAGGVGSADTPQGLVLERRDPASSRQIFARLSEHFGIARAAGGENDDVEH